MAAVGQQSGNGLPPSETSKLSMWPTRRCRQRLAREVQTSKLQAAFDCIEKLETKLASAKVDISSWHNKYEKLQEQVATTAAPTSVHCDREELVTRLSLEVPSLVDGILGESTATNEQTAKRNMAAHCFGVTALQIKDMNMAALNRVQRDSTMRKSRRRSARAMVRAHRRPPARRSAAEAVPTTGWSVAGRHGRRCKTQLSRERCCYNHVMAGAGGKIKEVTLTGAAWLKSGGEDEPVDEPHLPQASEKQEGDEEFFDCEKLADMLPGLDLQEDGQAHHDGEVEVEHATDDDDEKALKEYAELAKEEKLQEQFKCGPALALLQQVQATRQVPCGCGELLVSSTLAEVGVTRGSTRHGLL